jgi:GLPGLI family protein
MKKIYNFVAFLFLTFACFSQKNTVYLEYGIIISDDNGAFTKDKMFADYFLNAVKAAHKLTFGLIITKDGSKYYEVDTGIEKSPEMNMAAYQANYVGVIYNLENEVFKESKLLGNNIYTKEKKTENWILSSETKVIDGYFCYKATNTYTVVNSAGTFNFPVIAWYCPKLPYNYGPNGYGNLPGLILELQVRNINYGVKKIDLNSEMEFNLRFLDKASILTEEELNKKLDEFNNFDRVKK